MSSKDGSVLDRAGRVGFVLACPGNPQPLLFLYREGVSLMPVFESEDEARDGLREARDGGWELLTPQEYVKYLYEFITDAADDKYTRLHNLMVGCPEDWCGTTALLHRQKEGKLVERDGIWYLTPYTLAEARSNLLAGYRRNCSEEEAQEMTAKILASRLWPEGPLYKDLFDNSR